MAESEGDQAGGRVGVDAFTLDEEKGERFVAVTNPVPDLSANLRPGDNRYTNSAVVLDVRTGKLLWYKQTVPNDSHDWDLTPEKLIAARMRNWSPSPSRRW